MLTSNLIPKNVIARPWVAALLVALLWSATPGTAMAVIDSSAESKFVNLINTERVTRGLPALTVRSDLVSVAREHSRDMANSNHLHHNPNLGSDVDNWLRLAENVGVGPSVSSLHEAFMNSSGHRANILDGKVTEIGVGVEVRDGRLWVTQVFRLPQTSTSTASASKAVPLMGDWDGNGTATPGWFVAGRFVLANKLDGSARVAFDFGRQGDIPLVGDWNGDGKDTVGIVRDGTWHLVNRHRGGSSDISFDYGRVSKGDLPLVGDWNGDGKEEIGIVRDGEWHLRKTLSGGPGQIRFTYGRVKRGDVPLVGDWNGDGKDTVGIVRDGEWHLRKTLSGGPGQIRFTYGRVSKGDRPLVSDLNGDRADTPTAVRSNTWYHRKQLSGGSAHLTFYWMP